MVKRTLILLAATAVVAGCTGNIEDQLETLAADQQALITRLEALEEGNRQLRKALAASHTDSAHAPGPALAGALADRINTLLQEKVDATIEQQIASRIGTQDDIEAIFSEVVEEEMDSREEQERLQREQRRRQQTAERDKRDIERKSEAAGLDDERQKAVTLAMQEMRERLRKQLPEMKEQEASLEQMLAVVAESREIFESELLETLSEEELQVYYEADRWYGRQQRRVKEITTGAGLDEEQSLLVDDAYATMRETIGDGFTLMSEGYVGRGDIRQNFTTSRETFTASLKTIMTPEQYEAYESSDSGSRGRGFGGGPRF